MAYKVIVAFSDLEDNGHLYSVGDVYPRKEVTPTLDRVEFLLSCRNLLGKPVIEKTDTEEGTNEFTTEVKPVMNVPEKPIEATTGSAASKDVQEKPKRGRRKKA